MATGRYQGKERTEFEAQESLDDLGCLTMMIGPGRAARPWLLVNRFTALQTQIRVYDG